jgi:hypothetical protein
MLDKDLQRHAPEFHAHLAAHRYECTDEGIYFPRAKALAIGEYVHDVNGQDERTDHNLLPTEGLNHLLGVALSGVAPKTAWYLALFSGAYTPVAGVTAATFPSAATEITSATEGYSESTRRVWTPGTVATGQVDNVAVKAAFTIATATSLTIRGAALLSDSVKGATTGVLMSLSRFSADRVQYAGDVFNLGYRVRLQAT